MHSGYRLKVRTRIFNLGTLNRIRGKVLEFQPLQMTFQGLEGIETEGETPQHYRLTLL